jgi:tetratricopeptide (TPR) repeat protein
MAGAYHELRKHEEAIEACRQALRVNPKWPSAHESLASSCAETGRYAEAADALKRAIRIIPTAPHLHASLAEAYVELGDFEAATEEQRALRKLDPALAADVEKFIAARAKTAE